MCFQQWFLRSVPTGRASHRSSRSGRDDETASLESRHGYCHRTPAWDGQHPMMDDLNAGILLIVETAIETVAEHENVHALTLKIFTVIQL